MREDGGSMESRRADKVRSLLHIISASLFKSCLLLATTVLSALDNVLFKELKKKKKLGSV